MPRSEEKPEFQYAPPGLRRADTPAAGVLPDGVLPPGKRKADKPDGPKGVIYEGPPQPNSDIGMVMVMLALLGLKLLADRPGAGGIALGIVFAVVGSVGTGMWVRMWWTWRHAWGNGRWL